MSRTFRQLPYPNPRFYLRRFSETDTRAYQCRDRHVTYIRSTPREWVNMFATRPLRRHDVREIHRCIRRDCWDDHLPGIYRRKNFPHYW